MTAIVLAGGKSLRLGRNKAIEQFGAKPLIQHVIDIVSQIDNDIIVVAASRNQLPHLAPNIKIATDCCNPGSAAQGEIAFWKVRMKPGKPLAFGMIKGVPHLCLPGNPVGSMITFEIFARPAILKMMGKTKLAKPTVEVIMEEDTKNIEGLRLFLRAVVRKEGDRYYARTTSLQGPGKQIPMSQANALVIVPEDIKAVKEGDLLKAIILDDEM